ncbi:5-beta-cholestane-3-alpha,7-alpha-diol 12-alpha-hydroxylase [Talaromyces islandicus]|uniref:5-beta-cholestane-3-alpha,7-alpha-diol 12-alpha-hydroxylase n=1 Tax=Talaromyces islandicus TaxID=28573 RepID=A0A0U1M9U6_TALIS|nr:5-beta-cholestane-3-alpha,7-alpha-diol 12-alpha-hydroxylase [Talaromyces islandicus]
MPKLQTISGGITVKNCPKTLNLNLPALRNYTDLTLDQVDDITDQLNSPSSPIYDAMTGSLEVNLCNLTSIVRSAGGSLGGFTAQMSQHLTNVTMNSIESMTGTLSIENCPGISLNFANISSLSSATLRQIGSIDMPMLKKVNGDFQFDSNDALEALVLHKLTSVGSGNNGDFMITNNPNLSRIDVRRLKSVDGTLTLSNDGALGDLSSFGRVQNVGKDLTLLNLPIYAVNLGNLSGVGGQLELSSTYSGLKCENFSKFKQQVSFDGPLLCGNYTKIEDLPGATTGNSSNSPSVPSNDGSSTSPPSSSSTATTTATSTPNASPSASLGTIVGIVVSTVLALTLMGLVSVLLWRRRKTRQKKAAIAAAATPTESPRAPLFELKEDAMKPELSNDGQRYEMPSTSQQQVYEMPNEMEVFEMPAEPQRASWASVFNAQTWLAEGYEKYAKHGKSYLFPSFDGCAEIIIPRSSLSWLLEQPDSVLSAAEYHRETLVGDYNATHKHILRDPFHDRVIHKQLSRHLPALLTDIWEELSQAFDNTFGNDTAWKEINLSQSLMQLIARASNRMAVGKPTCREKEYLDNMNRFALSIIINRELLQFFPRIFWPLVARVMCARNSWYHHQTAKHSLPVIRSRLEHMRKKRGDPNYEWTEPNDYLSWHIKMAMDENRAIELDPVIISRRLTILNFAALHTTLLTTSNLLLDILGSPSQIFLDGIREEVEHVYTECGGVWTNTALTKLIRTDSAIRESMRVNNFMTRGVLRKVMRPEGIVNPQEGWTAPQGAYIGTDIHSVQHDSAVYPNPDEYDAFRFSRPVEENFISGRDTKSILQLKKVSLTTTSDTFLPFSHGRHACPGRFFVQAELKMIIAYLLLNYDVKHLAQRPPNRWIGSAVVPPDKETIWIKRKTPSA